MIGAALRRVEDLRFLTGAGRYIADVVFPGELHCAIVRSPHAHARVLSIRAHQEEGIFVLTGRDMEADGVGPMRCAWALAPLGVADLEMPATPHRVWQAIMRYRGDPPS